MVICTGLVQDNFLWAKTGPQIPLISNCFCFRCDKNNINKARWLNEQGSLNNSSYALSFSYLILLIVRSFRLLCTKIFIKLKQRKKADRKYANIMWKIRKLHKPCSLAIRDLWANMSKNSFLDTRMWSSTQSTPEEENNILRRKKRAKRK